MRKVDAIASLVIGEASGLLMLAIGRNINLPQTVGAVLPWLPLAFPIFTLAVLAAGSFLGRAIPVAYQFIKFILVGGLNFLIDLGVLNLLIFATGILSGFYANVFKALAFIVAVIFSFFWNKFWTFGALSIENTALQFAEFFIVSAVGLGVNVGSFALLNDVVGPQAAIDERTWASVSAGGAAIVGLVWNFLGYKFIVFRRPAV